MIDQLYPFQRKDVDKLQNKLACLIINDMGTGKTFEAIALDIAHREETQLLTGFKIKPELREPKTLVVAPLSVLGAWERTYRQLTDLKVKVINPKKRELFLKGEPADVYILHYDVLRLMPELQKVQWLHIIADECQRIQHRKSSQTKEFKKLKTVYKTAMSGTPYTTKIDKLWSVLNWIDPKPSTKGGFGSYHAFFKQYVPWFEDHDGYTKVMTREQAEADGPMTVVAFDKLEAKLQSRIAPFTVRHTKEEVTPELPEKYYTTHYIDLLPIQRRAYDQMHKHAVAWVGSNEDQMLMAPVVISQLVRLQQFAGAHATIILLPNNKKQVKLQLPSAKMDFALEMVQDAEDKQFVFFSQFSQVINLFAGVLSNVGISHSKLIGDTPHKLRGGIIDRFQAGDTRIFLSTIKAGGAGITLTSANTVVFFDRAWSPADNAQAEDRLHRIGQRSSVQVVDLVASQTIERDRTYNLKMGWEAIRRLLEPEKFSE